MIGMGRGMKGDGILKIDMCFVFLFKIFSRTRRLKAGTEHKREKQEQNICFKKKKRKAGLSM